MARPAGTPVAIVGMGCRLPGGVAGADDYLELLRAGRCAIAEIPPARWALAGFYDPEGAPGRSVTRWGGFLDAPFDFDAEFFGFSRREALAMDPQQRIALEVAWEALEDAGLPADRLAGTAAGVYIGASLSDFAAVQRFRPTGADLHAGTGTALSIVANRLSHRLDLRGPSVVFDTACSSALVALHHACQAIARGECETALAGGVHLLLDPGAFVNFSRANMMSPTGRVHTFDARADGYVRGEGVALVVLKPLARALADGDRIHGVIRATATNQDGRTSTITVPSGAAQETLLRAVCAAAGVAADDLGYVEAHGTGTPVGDPIEAGAIGRALGLGRRTPLWVGSGKPNIGHLESAAGIAGLMKAALSVSRRVVLPNLNFEHANPAIDLPALNLRVPTAAEPWPDDARCAAVNSFGFGGSNACALIEAPPPPPVALPAAVSRAPVVFTVSAPDDAALTARAAQLADALPDALLPALAATAAQRRAQLRTRAAVVAADAPALREGLRALAAGAAHGGVVRGRAGSDVRPVFVFSGQGSQWWAMGRGLLEHDAVFRAALQRFDAAFSAVAGWSLLPELLRDEAESRIDRTLYTQPGICAVQIGLTEVLRAAGVMPAAVLGHSVGEVAALYAAGGLTLDGAARVIHARATLQDGTEGAGGIAAVGLSAAAATALLVELGVQGVEIAAVNAPELINLAGDAAGVEAVLAHLAAHRPDVFQRRIRMRFAAHSHHMDPLREPLLAALAGLDARAPAVPFISTVTGDFHAGAPDGPYWWRNVREPVHFDAAVRAAMGAGHALFLEVGPHAQLAGLVAQALAGQGTVAAALRRGEDDLHTVHTALATLHVNGAAVDFGALYGPAVPPVTLPAWPWRHQTLWTESEERQAALVNPEPHPLLGRRLRGEAAQWLQELSGPRPAWLADHALGAEAVFPAAGYLELMLAAGGELFGAQTLELEHVRFAQALFLREDAPEFVLTHYDAARETVRVLSRRRDGAPDWTLRAQAVLRARTLGVPPAPPEPAAGAGTLDADAFYAKTVRHGYAYGPAFCAVQTLVSDGARARAHAVLPAGLDATGYRLHPALLDGCIQTGIALLAEDPARLYLPVSVRRLRWYAPMPRQVHAHLLAPDGAHGAGEVLDIRTPDGAPVARLEGLVMQPLGAATTAGTDGAPDGYVETWAPADDAVPAGATTPGLWLLVADAPASLPQADYPTADHPQADHPPAKRALTDGLDAAAHAAGGVTVHLPATADFGAALAGLAQAPRAVVFLPGAHAPAGGPANADAVHAQVDAGLWPLTALARALPTDAGAPRLYVLTRNAVPVGGSDGANLAGAALAGVVRVLRSERPALRATRVDLPADGAPDTDARALAAVLVADGAHADLAWRNGTWFAPRLSVLEAADRVPRRGPREAGAGFCITQPRAGVVESLDAVAMPLPAPRRGEVVVEVAAVGLNFRDVMAATGLLPPQAEPTPAHLALGLECAGTVVAAGAGVRGFAPGTPVLANVRGALRSHVCVPAAALLALPPDLDLRAAATLPTAFMTAWHALVTVGRLRRGERVLIHTATGGVGLAAIQVARACGAQVLATAGSDEKRAVLRALGVTTVADSRSLDFADAVRAATGGQGVDVILNALPGPFIRVGLELLAPYGRFLEIGKRDVYADSAVGLRALARNVSLHVIDLARLGEERPADARAALRALGKGLADGRFAPLPRTDFAARRVADAVRHMAQARHVGKVVVDLRDPDLRVAQDLSAPLRLRAEGSYLVTGGARGFGLDVARMLAGAGAGEVIVLSRTPPGAADLDTLRRTGARITVALGDVTDRARLRAVLAGAGHPLRGVFHAAMVLDDALIEQLTPAHYTRVLAPKVLGAWLLHELTADAPLDHFVLFSSVAAVFGSAGQANYVAANATLDALARHRHARGLPALSVNWGPLGGSGVVARNAAMARYLESLGLRPVDGAAALAALADALRTDTPQLTAAHVDFAALMRASPALRDEPRLAALVRDDASVGGARAGLLARSGPARLAATQDYLRTQVAQVLRCAPGDVDATRPLTELGLDSLTAFELKNRIEADLDVSLPTSRFLQAPTVHGLAAAVVEQLAQAGAGDAGDRDADGTPDIVTTATPATDPHRDVAPVQEWMWQLYRARPVGDPARRSLELAFALEITGAMDPARLAQACEAVATRHAQLRARFPALAGRPVLAAHDAPVFREVAPGSGDDAAFMRALEQALYAPYDLESGPLFGVELHPREPGRAVLAMRAHHLVLDGWTGLHVLNEVLGAYLGLPDPAPASATFTDFAHWQRDLLDSPRGATLRAFWARQVADPPPAVALPWDRPAEGSPQGRTLDFALPAGLTEAVLAQARAWKLSYFSVLLAAFQALMYTRTGAADLPVTSTATGRTQGRFEAVVGNFTNQLVLRLRYEPQQTLRANAQASAAVLADALAHQDLPFTEYLPAARMATPGSALDQLCFAMRRPDNFDTRTLGAVLLSESAQGFEFGGTRLRTLALARDAGLRPLSVFAQESGGVLHLLWNYDATRFDAGTIEALAADYAAGLAAAVGAVSAGRASRRGARA